MAPTLTEYLATWRRIRPNEPEFATMTTELRALLAVARAARRAVPVLNTGSADLAEAGYEQTSIDVRIKSDSLDRALSRLDRLASPGKRPR